MTLSELIAEYGNDKVQFQRLDECASDINYAIKTGTRITFVTDEPVDLNGTVKMGLLLWLDRARVAEILAKSRATPTPEEKAE